MKASNSNLWRPLSLGFASIVVVASLGACAAAADPDIPASNVDVDQAEIVKGTGDKGRNPAVVALGIGDIGLCTATLIAPDVVLTARHCVSVTSESVACPAQGPQITGERRASSLRILVGDDVSTAREVAHGRQVLVPQSNQLCDDDIALVVLDREVPDIAPLVVHQQGIAKGGHVTAIGYGRAGDDAPAGVKLLREHVRVLETSSREFLVGEATCQGDSGGPALDEASGEIVGVVSRGGPGCDGASAHNIYTRTDAFLSLVDRALALSTAKAPPKKKPKDSSDMGAACARGSDCATGLCVKEPARQYCSRPCDSADHCPTHFRCTAAGARTVCVEH